MTERKRNILGGFIDRMSVNLGLGNVVAKGIQEGKISPWLLVEKNKYGTLLQLNPVDLPEDFLLAGLEKNSWGKILIKYRIGLSKFSDRQLNTSRKLIDWLPFIGKVINGSSRDGSQKGSFDDLDPDKIERFYSSFPYPSAKTILINLLEGEIPIAGEILSSQYLRDGESKNTYTTTEYHGSWRGESEWEEEVTERYRTKIYKRIYKPRYPVADGTKRSLIIIADATNEYRDEITKAIKKFDSKPKQPLEYIIEEKDNLIDVSRKQISETRTNLTGGL